jgi:hypothetical protein
MDFGSTPVNANGSFGCPFNTNFVDVDLNTTYARVQASCLEAHNASNSGFLCNDVRFGDGNAAGSGAAAGPPTGRNSATLNKRISKRWGIGITVTLFCFGVAGTIPSVM